MFIINSCTYFQFFFSFYMDACTTNGTNQNGVSIKLIFNSEKRVWQLNNKRLRSMTNRVISKGKKKTGENLKSYIRNMYIPFFTETPRHCCRFFFFFSLCMCVRVYVLSIQFVLQYLADDICSKF